MNPRLELRIVLERARDATHQLLAPLTDEMLVAETPPGTPRLVADLAQIAYFEELWLLRSLAGRPSLADEHQRVYKLLEPGRRTVGRRPELRVADVRAYVEDVRERVLDLVEHMDLEGPNPLLRDGFVFGLVIQHELQTQEAMTETLQLMTDVEYPLPDPEFPDRAPGGRVEVYVPGGWFVLGAVAEPWAYDNELEPHEVELPAFHIDRAPVTNAAFAEFVLDRGYETRTLWTDPGWEWRERDEVRAPAFWQQGETWERVRLGHHEPVPSSEPVQHVSWHEASAFARWAGKRLPTEAEWERAASWHPRQGKQRYPWGREWTGYEASLDRRRLSPAAAGSYAGGTSPVGCVQMVGDVWEWTASSFEPYPDFESFPYPEYSEAFFGDVYRVLRGGSWATNGLVARTSFRRPELPETRHAFAGFRCARDA